MIQKENLFFKTMESFVKHKVSADVKNSTYRQGSLEGIPSEGEPDVMWQSVVFIKQTQQIWTHGEFFGPNACMKVRVLTQEEWDLLTNNDTDYSQLEPNTTYKVGEELLAPAPVVSAWKFGDKFPITFGNATGNEWKFGDKFPVKF